jgi:hypothetical protein
MDRFELARIARQVDQAAETHNQAPGTVEEVNNRNCFINNTAGYSTGNVVHDVQTLQIASREDWNNLGAIFPIDNRDFFDYPRQYIEDLLSHFDQGHGNAYGDLLVSLLREENHENGIHRAIFIIFVNPHRRFLDGDFVFTEYTDGDATHLMIQEMFDENPYSMVETLTEYDILNLAASQLVAEYLMYEFFYDGFVSMRFVDEEQNQPQQLPPPPPEHELDLALIYIEQLANYPDEEFGNNIIPYWLENEEHRQQLREIQAERNQVIL